MTNQLLDYSSFVKLVIDALDAVGVRYLIGGAMAAWAWGEPRSTLDLDVVVDIPLEAVEKLSQELEKRGMLVPAEIIMNAIIEDRADLPINAIHMDSGFKADLYPLRSRDALRESSLDRRARIDFGPPVGEVYIHSPEDLILYKIWYFSLSQQTKHVRDIAAILQTVGDEIDYTYIESWLEKKGLQSTWQEILRIVRS